MPPPAPSCPPPHPDPKVPALRLPPLSCDAHCHIFGPAHRFPYAPDRTFTPPDVSKDDLRRRHDHLGFERAVIVQSSCHGSDHTALLDALASGQGRYRGVALVTPQTPAREVARLDAAGVRGARLNFLPHLGQSPSPEDIRALVRLLATGTVWVKLSGADRLSLTGPPYPDAVALARLLASHAPERVLWGTDYPPPQLQGDP